MSAQEQASSKDQAIRVFITKMGEDYEPPVKESRCQICGGTIRWNVANFSSTWTDHKLNTITLEIGELKAFRCDYCNSVFIPSDISEQIETEVDKVRGYHPD